MADEPLWSAEDVARYLNVSLSTVYVLARKRDLPAVRIGVQWRFHPEAVRAFARGETPGAPPDPLLPRSRRRT
jgi:excisionase family DNA binding protein